MAHRALVMLDEKNEAGQEAYKNLITNLFFSKTKTGQTPRVILVTSTQAGEGKTITAANTAIAFSKAGYKTVLIDADMRRPRVHQLFELPNQNGLFNILSKESALSACLRTYGKEGLGIITSGPTSYNVTKLNFSEIFSEMIANLKNTHDRIIIDTPPIGQVSDTAAMVMHVDGVLTVVTEGVTKKREILKMNDHLAYLNADLLGIVYNKAGLQFYPGTYASYGLSRNDY